MDFIQRMVVELSELREKKSKLIDFMSTSKFQSLMPEMQSLLRMQANAMSIYADTLDMRLTLLNNSSNNISNIGSNLD